MFCVYCGNKVKDDDAFCSKCGKKLYGARRTIPQQQSSSYKVYQDTRSRFLPRTNKKKKHIPIVITAILLLAVIGLCSFFAIWFFSAYRSSISDRHDSALEIAASPTEKDKINHEYRLWEWNFPKPLADETEKELTKKRIQKQMEELQGKLKELDNM